MDATFIVSSLTELEKKKGSMLRFSTDSDEQKQLLKEDPEAYLAYRKMIEREINQRFSIIVKGTDEAKGARKFSENEMRSKLQHDELLCDKIIPKSFPVGCRRPTPGNGYLEAIVGEKTKCFTETIQHVTESGFVDSTGAEYDVDAIICATGFDTSWIPRFPTVVNGTDLRDTWTEEGVTSYLSVGVPNVPNYFTFCGPYGPLAHGSFFPIIERYTEYIVKVIDKMQDDCIRSLHPRRDVADQFMQHAKTYLHRTAWTESCSSWFKGGKADATPTIYPGSRVSFLRLMKNPRYEDFSIQYDSLNRFGFLGNGYAVEEHDGSDQTDYLGVLKSNFNEEELKRLLKGTAPSVLQSSRDLEA